MPIDPIVIIGAGPSGLLLARYLELHRIPVVIYERDSSPTHRPQGGSLDLHDETGLKALKETGLLDEAKSYMRAEGEAMKIVDKRGKIWYDENDKVVKAHTGFHEGGPVTGRPEIDRTDLRNILIKSLGSDTIKWGHTVSSCSKISSSHYQINFVSQPYITTPFLIGADGAFSRVRPLIHSTLPSYSGVSMYELTIPPKNVTPELKTYVGQGCLLALDEGMAVLPQMNSEGLCKVYVGLRCPENWTDENPLPDKKKREWLANLFQDWHDQVRDVIMASEEDKLVTRRIWQFDPDLKWDTDLTGVTVMGDAAHVMSPFAGEGVNQALADALELGKTLVSLFIVPTPRASSPPFPLSLLPISQPRSKPLISSPPPADLHHALRRFERKMMRRARKEMIGSKENMDMFFGENAARNLTHWMSTFMIRFVWQTVTEWPVDFVKAIWD
ncbi:monooxygenase [Cryptococcus neoformans Bt63]|nr:monooxygenase [Cryptococcus neoformans var. grubii Bt63]